jgi:hypothetical protein
MNKVKIVKDQIIAGSNLTYSRGLVHDRCRN